MNEEMLRYLYEEDAKKYAAVLVEAARQAGLLPWIGSMVGSKPEGVMFDQLVEALKPANIFGYGKPSENIDKQFAEVFSEAK